MANRYQDDVNRLRTSLETEADFGKTVDLFHDGLAQSFDFMAVCVPADAHTLKTLRSVVESGVGRALGQRLKLDGLQLFSYPPTDFVHGFAPLADGLVVFFYFDQVNQGMAIIDRRNSPTMFVRLTAVPLTAGARFTQGTGNA